MPQFDVYSFYNQVTFVFLFFSLVYCFIDYSVLPAVVTSLKIRQIKQANNSTLQPNGLSSIANIKPIDSTCLRVFSYSLIKHVFFKHYINKILTIKNAVIKPKTLLCFADVANKTSVPANKQLIVNVFNLI